MGVDGGRASWGRCRRVAVGGGWAPLRAMIDVNLTPAGGGRGFVVYVGGATELVVVGVTSQWAHRAALR